MNITQSFSWSAVNWPTTTGAASQYAVFQLYPVTNTPTTPITTITTTQVSLPFDDSGAYLFQVRPTDGLGTYGPETASFVVNYIPCRAYVRQRVRYALADQISNSGVSPNWSDEEINGYLNEAIVEVSQLFPAMADTTINLIGMQVINGQSVGTRTYALPTDFYTVRSVEYVKSDGNLHLYLKEKPFRGGETTSTSYVGYPKLGILISPTSGRYYPGHFSVYENNIYLDWDPNGNGDYLHILYSSNYPLFTDDGTLTTMPREDLELLSLRAQMKCWLRVEGSDTRLSRFREVGKRDDLPTEKMSSRIKNLYNEIVNDRREKRVRTYRLVRR